ncbi:hypothetical protein EUTSA_v10000459mg, partial [Eutrema salsugineum]
MNPPQISNRIIPFKARLFPAVKAYVPSVVVGDSVIAVEGPASSSNSTVAVNLSSPSLAQQERNWASLLKDSSQLEEVGEPSQHVTGVPFVLIPDENIESAKEEFKDFIFARFHGDSPVMGRIIGVVNAIWARTGPRIFVHNIGPGIYLLKVSNPRTREILLSRSMWNIAGFPTFVAPWSPEFSLEVPPLTSAVVPVEFRQVPYLLFNKQSLSRLATAIGKPVKLAPETERKENFEVTKVYVRIDLQKELPSKIVSGFSNGREVLISVSYPWMPVKCCECGHYGHEGNRCHIKSLQ